jgi:hypothetical protein
MHPKFSYIIEIAEKSNHSRTTNVQIYCSVGVLELAEHASSPNDFGWASGMHFAGKARGGGTS